MTALLARPSAADTTRGATALVAAADLLEQEEWHPFRNPLMDAIDRAVGYVPGKGGLKAENTTLAAWDLLCLHLGCEWAGDWERQSGRTQVEVLSALRGAAKAVRG
ncbi:hypothetical protein ACFXGR_22270 [Streptomyces mirabilis]|uniref:DUF6197 family protein n=1 Tax=Streptomyces mirabilis TaxID=68239 RepID=UPI0036AE7740